MPVRVVGDERLATMVRRGDEAAFAELFRRYHQLVYRYCRSLVRDEHDAQDALQITFTNALLALRSRRLDAPLRPWLLRIAHNESISLVRRRRPDVELPAETRAGHVDLRAVDASDDAAAERERLALLLADLRELPERQRGALVMREMSGFSHYEIALSLGITVGAAKQTILEARRGLMEMAEGRSMECEEVQRIVSDGDRRLLRARRIRGHLRDCAVCSAFAAAIPERSADMLVLWPMLPALTAGAVLRSVGAQATAAGHGGGGGVAAAGTKAGAAAGTKAGAIGLTTKAVAAGAVAAAVIGGLVIAQQSGTTPAKHLIASAPRSSGTPPAPAGQSSPARHGRVTPDRHQRAGPGKPTVKSTAGVSTSSVAPVSNHAQDQRQAQTPRFSRTIASPQAPAGSKPTGVTHTSPASSSPTVTQPPRTSNPTGSTTTTAPAVGAHPPASSSTVTTTPATTTTGSTTTRTSTTSTKTSTTPTTATSPSTTPTTTGPSQPLLGLTVTLGITTPSLPPLLPGGHFSP